MTDDIRSYLTHNEITDLVIETQLALNAADIHISFEFNGRFTNRMGDAHWLTRRVRFSTPLWRRASAAERRQTIIHEVCHIIANVKAGRSVGHGPIWKATMRAAGVRPDRCHAVDRTGLRRRNVGTVDVVCNCPGKTHALGRMRVARMRAGIAKYCCRSCKSPVRFA